VSDVASETIAALEALRVADEELRQQNEALLEAQGALDEERMRYRELFDLAPVAYLVTDEHGKIVEVNETAGELLATPRAWLAGKPLAVFVPASDRRKFRALLLRLGATESPAECELRLVPRGRDLLIVRARAVAVGREGGPRELRWSLEDVTELRQTEVELRVLAAELESRVAIRTEEAEAGRARLAAILAAVPVGIVLVEAETGLPETANEAAAEIYGGVLDPAQREGYRPDGSRYGADEWPVMRSLRTGKRIEGESAEVVRPDGSRVLVELGSAPIRDPQGKIVSAVSVVHDVTERERRQVAEREFVTNAAHELRTPLAAIAGAIEVLQAGAKDDGETRDRFLGHIEQESKRLQRLVQALLTLARAETGAEAAKVEIVPLLGLVEEAIEALEQAVVVPVEIDCPADLGAIANRELLERVVANLVANAVQNTSEGKIAIRAVPTDDVVELSVTDTGRGIEPEERDRVFDRFFRGTRDRNGFGLGLAIVSQAVRVMDGTIEVDSPEGGGTVVRVRLRAATVLTS
jgi:PAS domain S-box-containing protein